MNLEPPKLDYRDRRIEDLQRQADQLRADRIACPRILNAFAIVMLLVVLWMLVRVLPIILNSR